jgi:hypothetical protein
MSTFELSKRIEMIDFDIITISSFIVSSKTLLMFSFVAKGNEFNSNWAEFRFTYKF